MQATQFYNRKSLSRTPAARRGFTLLELLVVLAILAIAAAILFPVFSAARGAVLRTSCGSNMHQVSLAITLYTQDYDDAFPSFMADARNAAHAQDLVYWDNHFCRGTHLHPDENCWANLAAPYVSLGASRAADTSPHTVGTLGLDFGPSNLAFSRMWEVFRCPADRGWQTRPITSYEFKMWLAQGLTVSQVETPPGMALFWEQWDYHRTGKYSSLDRRAEMNLMMVDGHLEWTRLSQTTSARFGTGPDLRWVFEGETDRPDANTYRGRDIL